MRYLKVLFIVVLFFLCMVFFVQNTEVLANELRIRFELFGLHWLSAPTPVYVYILIAFVVGAVVTMVYLLLERIRQGREIKHYKIQIQKLQEEINSLRNMPLEEDQTQVSSEQTSS